MPHKRPSPTTNKSHGLRVREVSQSGDGTTYTVEYNFSDTTCSLEIDENDLSEFLKILIKQVLLEGDKKSLDILDEFIKEKNIKRG